LNSRFPWSEPNDQSHQEKGSGDSLNHQNEQSSRSNQQRPDNGKPKSKRGPSRKDDPFVIFKRDYFEKHSLGYDRPLPTEEKVKEWQKDPLFKFAEMSFRQLYDSLRHFKNKAEGRRAYGGLLALS
jgi:hypothetical protein